MNNNLNAGKVNERGGILIPVTPRESPQRSSPKHKGIRVTFDGSSLGSSLNSSPKSRSSREKDEEEFRTNVAQSLGLAGGPIPLHQPCGIQSEKSTEKHPEMSMASKRDVQDTTLSENDIPLADEDVPAPDEGYLQDAGRKNSRGKEEREDGMAEYAAHYTEPPPPYKEVDSKAPQDDVLEPCPKGSDISSRKELREPDGASGASSPSGIPSKDAPGGKYPSYPSDIQYVDKEPKTRKKKYSGAGVEEPSTSDVPDKSKSSESPIEQNEIPDTNIAVACLVTLCFNLPFGALAIYFSLMATKAYRDGKTKQGAKKARISIYISLFSIVVTVLIVMTVILVRAIDSQAKQRQYKTKTSVSL